MPHKAQSKKNGSVGTKTKGAMAMAKAVAEKVKRSHEKGKTKKLRLQQQESDDELPEINGAQETEEESGEEKSDTGDRSGDFSSDTEMQLMEKRAEVENKNREMDTLNKQKEQLSGRIEDAKKTNEAKLTELRKTLDAYPSVSFCAVIPYNFRLIHTEDRL
jgi:hypothetical protein